MISDPRPTASVVVCAYNESALIESCLRGLVMQTYPTDRFDIIVVDDESEDDTYGIVEQFAADLPATAPRVHLVGKTHGGLSHTRNMGIALSAGEIVAFIDADAVPARDWLERMIAGLTHGADYVGGRIDVLNETSWVARFLQNSRHRQFFGPRVFNDHFIGANMAFRRSVFEHVGGFVENFTSRGDESTLRERLPESLRYGSAPDAVVLHERPESLWRYLRIEWQSALLDHLAQRVLGTGTRWRVLSLRIEQSLILLLPVAALLTAFWPGLFLPALAVAIAAAVRRFYMRPLGREIARGLVREYGWLRGTAGHLIVGGAVNAIQVVGAVVGRFRYRRVALVEPMTSRPVILRSFDTHGSENR